MPLSHHLLHRLNRAWIGERNSYNPGCDLGDDKLSLVELIVAVHAVEFYVRKSLSETLARFYNSKLKYVLKLEFKQKETTNKTINGLQKQKKNHVSYFTDLDA